MRGEPTAPPDPDPWARVHAIEFEQRRQFDPLARRLIALGEEKMQSLLEIVEGTVSASSANVIIGDLLFELAWISDLSKTEETPEESWLWDDVKRLVDRRAKESGESFRFPLWTIYVGRRVAEAWMHRDAEFFARHADLWRNLCNKNHSLAIQFPTNAARICAVAIALRDRFSRNPTKKELREEVAMVGLRINDKDWPKYLRKCCLTFLPHARAGRPNRNSRPAQPRKSDGYPK